MSQLGEPGTEVPLGRREVGAVHGFLPIGHTHDTATGNTSVTASATALPFPDDSFGVVFGCGLLHHLPEALARQAVAEMMRVTRPCGHVILFDPVLPKAARLRPIAWGLCRLDRGRFIRSQKAYESSPLDGPERETQRFTHSYLGTEGRLCRLTKAPSRVSARDSRGGERQIRVR